MLQTESLLNPCRTELVVLREDWCLLLWNQQSPGWKEPVQWRGQVAGLQVFFLGLKHWAVMEGLRQVSGLRYLNQPEQ